MKKPKLREITEAIRSFISEPYTSRFPEVPVTLPDGFRGRPKYDRDFCVGCKACAEVCPARAIDILDTQKSKGRGVRKLTQHYDICIFCGQCEKACITEKGITLSKEFELSAPDRGAMIDEVEKELVFCEKCGGVIGAIDHIKFLAKKLGPLAFSNPTVFLARHDDLTLLEKTAPRGEAPHKRSDYLRMLCPNCRREAIFTEEWGQ
ncbi:MAG: 4Fe-4S dicluster domain-containing protein [Candidatus Saganbacteria bacterium]|nr:4Fe-4S dicluster domain-containing protein [Candidatus Saganbacteria bacterium]